MNKIQDDCYLGQGIVQLDVDYLSHRFFGGCGFLRGYYVNKINKYVKESKPNIYKPIKNHE